MRDALRRSSPTKRIIKDNTQGNITLDELMSHRCKKAKATPSSTCKPSDKSTHIPKPTARKSMINTNTRRRATLLVHNETPVYTFTTNKPHNKEPVHPSSRNVAATPRANVPSRLTSSASNKMSYSNADVKIRVCIRKRPLTKEEMRQNEQDIALLSSTRTIEIHAPK